VEQSWSPGNLRDKYGMANGAAGLVNPSSFVGNVYSDSRLVKK